MPAAAVYFRDPDGHLIEYLAMLDEPARPERGIVPWSDWMTDEPSAEAVRVERYTGPRSELRALFEEAEDSALGAGRVHRRGRGPGRSHTSGAVVGHLQLIDDRPPTRARSRTWPSRRHTAAAESAAR